MPLHLEQVIGDVQTYLQANLPAALATVLSEQSVPLALSCPRPDSYFIGARQRYRAYDTPAFFFLTPETVRPNEGGSQEYSTTLEQEHRVLLDILVEATTEEDLTRLSWRMAQAVDQCLHDHEVTPDGTATRATKIFIPKIEFDPTVPMPEGERRFRKDTWVTLTIRHWDLLTS